MAMIPKPTKAQIRQHALDRALQSDVVHGITGGQAMRDIDEFADHILKIAGRFEIYLSDETEVRFEVSGAEEV